MRRTMNRSGLESDEEVEVTAEAPEPAAEWTEGSQKGNVTTTVNMQI